MDKCQYINIMANDIPSSSTKIMLNDFVFQQNNDPKHASKYAKVYFREKKHPRVGMAIVIHENIHVLEWLSSYIKTSTYWNGYRHT